MADKILPDKLTKEKLAEVIKDLEPGTLLVIDLPGGRGRAGYAVSTQKEERGKKDAAGI
jgi:hypothetical protein